MNGPNLSVGAVGEEVRSLHERLRRQGHELPESETSRAFFGPGTREAVRRVQLRHGLQGHGVVDAATNAVIGATPRQPVETSAIPRAADQPVMIARGAAASEPRVPVRATDDVGELLVRGTIVLEYGLPAANLVVRAYNRGFGGKDALLREGKTDAGGAFALTYQAAGTVNLELRALDAENREVSLSETRFGAQSEEQLHLVAPTAIRPLAPEFDRLQEDLKKALSGAAIAGAREGGGRQDLSIARELSRWDARLVALAATAAKQSATSKVPADALYALYRLGLPSEPARLARVGGGAIDAALKRAVDAGLVAGGARLKESRAAIASFQRSHRKQAKAAGAVSSLGELLGASGLTTEEQDRFSDLYFTTSKDELWARVSTALPVESVAKLRTQGKLGALTFNNGPVMNAVMKQATGEAGLGGLVDAGYYKPETWAKTLKGIGGELNGVVPPAYSGATLDDRVAAYTEDLARKVRIAYPTRVVGHMLEQGELSVGGDATAVGTFLKKASESGFELGRVPIEQAFSANGNGGLGLARPSEGILDGVRVVQRVFQITPSNEAMQVMFDEGLYSAHDVVSLRHDRFLAYHGDKFRTVDEAERVWRRSSQVHSVTYGLFTTARSVESSTPLHAVSGIPAVRESAIDSITKHYPSMAELFGSLDFCECKECRSVLSPAAYLVDLLQFINPPGKVWDSFVLDWNSNHAKHFAPSFAADYDKPFDQLDRRRPDLKYLPLTCENTNTALPYIDVVNEILEYYVVHGNLDGDKGNDTGDATSQELLAEPQHTNSDAYNTLLGRTYPLGLPFDLWIATVRAFLAYFDTPLAELLETFRATDELFDPKTGASAHCYRSQIFVESLGISPSEWALFTRPDPGADWWTLYGYTGDSVARTALASAKTLANRLGLTYRQLVDVLETGFVNPTLAGLVVLSKIGIDVGDVYRYENAAGSVPMSAGERTAYEQQLADFHTATGFDAATWLHTQYLAHAFDGILVLADSDPGCNFDKTKLQYANGNDATGVDFVKLNLFVRLWRKLGWTIPEVDRALTALVPSGTLPLTSNNIAPALGTAIIYIAHLAELLGSLAVGKNARLKLPTLWTDISTAGKNSLYAQLFLTPRAVKNDPIFDDPVGHYLQGGLFLKDHRAGVQAALTLTAREVDAILADATIDLATAPLSIPTVSLLYRYGLFSRALKLSIADFIALKKLSGLDPLAAIQAAPLNSDATNPPVSPVSADHPFSQTIAFVELARDIEATGFSVAELQYLLVHDPDSVARFRPDQEPALALLTGLRRDIAQIRRDNMPPDDPATLDDETLRQKLALVLPGPVVEAFTAMLAGTVEYTAAQDTVLPGDAIDPEPLAEQPLTVDYDSVTQQQRLTFTGVLLGPQKTTIETIDNSTVLVGLLDDVQAQARAFYDKWFGAFLQPADYATIFAPIPATPLSAAEAAVAARRTALSNGLFPYVQSRLIRQLVVTALSATLDADPVLVESLVTDAAVLYDATAPSGTALLDAFASADQGGLAVSWFTSTDCSGAPIGAQPTTATADTASKPGGTNSARFRGALQVVEGGPYRFFAELDNAVASAQLSFEHLPNPVVAATGADPSKLNAEVDLKAGVPYPFTLEVHSLSGGDAHLLVLGETLPKDRLDRLTLYPQTVIDRVHRADVVLAKVIRLLQGFVLGEAEIAHLLTHAADFSNLDLSRLPATKTTSGVAARLEQFMRIARYAALKRALELDGTELIDVFAHARRTFDGGADPTASKALVFDDVCARFAALTRREPSTVSVVAKQLGFIATSAVVAGWLVVEVKDFAQERGLRRLWDALELLENLGVPADAIGRWVPIVDGASLHRDLIAADVKNTVKARFEDDAWYSVAQPVFDSLRKLKRDALVTYILDKESLETSDKLYERFLLDPGMQPVVQTSRIQLAISSVQLFIQRCLLNLEERVPPRAIIDAPEWDWLKRYRLWEANRRIFLFPENWLEPEWRTDKTNLFRDLEGSLLSGDVTADAAEDAFLAYLQGLEAIARLEIVSMYVEEPDDGIDILHVIGRSYTSPHKYYYRRFTDTTWMPWEPVDAEIEGDHVAAVKWRNRIHIFWGTFAAKARHTATASSPRTLADTTPNAAVQRQVEVRLNWTALVEGSWTTRSSSSPLTVITSDITNSLDTRGVPIFVSIETRPDGTEGAVVVHFAGEIQRSFRIATKNSPPRVVDPDSAGPPTSYYSTSGWDATIRTGENQLSIYYPERIVKPDFGVVEETDTRQLILGAQPHGRWGLLLGDSALRLPRPDLAPLTGPFFYADDTNTFFVAPEVREDTFDQWESWVVDDGPDDRIDWEIDVPVWTQVPEWEPPIPDPGDPWSKYQVDKRDNWVTDPATVIEFGDAFIHANGAIDLGEVAEATGYGAVVGTGAGSAIGAGTQFVSTARGDTGSFLKGSGVLVVGSAGLSGAALASLGGATQVDVDKQVGGQVAGGIG